MLPKLVAFPPNLLLYTFKKVASFIVVCNDFRGTHEKRVESDEMLLQVF